MSLPTFAEEDRSVGKRSPISRLPTELLTEVFKYSLPLPLDHFGRHHFMSLRSICSVWRAIGFSTPSLWSGLAIDAWEVHPSRGTSATPFSLSNANSGRLTGSGLLPLVRAWFDRASSSPLILRVTNKHGDEDQYRLRDLLEVPYDDRRWLELDIDIPIDIAVWGSRDMLSIIAKAPHRPWKHVQSLSLRCTQHGWEVVPYTSLSEALIPLGQCAPAVQTLKLIVERLGASLPQLHHNISTLHLILIKVNLCFIAKNVVGQLPNLRYLSVKGKKCAKWTPTSDWPQDTWNHYLSSTGSLSVNPKSPVTSKSIQDLEVGRDGVYIINYLSLPRLQHLRVGSGTMGFGGDVVDFIVDLIARSGCRHSLLKLDLRKLQLDERREAASTRLRRVGHLEGAELLL
jgi:F-box-like